MEPTFFIVGRTEVDKRRFMDIMAILFSRGVKIFYLWVRIKVVKIRLDNYVI